MIYMYSITKRFFDIIISIIGIIILIPMTIIIKILYILTADFNSIFYTQKRVGKNEKIFKIIKFRTMIPNADKILEEMLKDKNIKKEYEYAYKLKNDPRITKIGKILRILSIDEFPQFINVLIGDMSIVGPRPVIVKELKMYGKNKKLLLSVKPGLTGNWVIHGRNDLKYKQRIKYEIEYIKNKNILLDTRILFKTITYVIRRKGAL